MSSSPRTKRKKEKKKVLLIENEKGKRKFFEGATLIHIYIYISAGYIDEVHIHKHDDKSHRFATRL